MIKYFITLILITQSIWGEVANSIISIMDNPNIESLITKLSLDQLSEVQDVLQRRDEQLRVMSFNMLSDAYDERIEHDGYRWEVRKGRLEEYLKYIQPDLIGAQELSKNQIDWMKERFDQDYSFYGVGRDDGVDQGEIQAIIYKKGRLRLIRSDTHFTPGDFGKKNALTECYFEDLATGKTLIVLNAHFAFSNLEARIKEAKWVSQFIQQLPQNIAIILTGDFNTFPFTHELNLPFCDGDYVVKIIKESGIEDSRHLGALGHFGPNTTTSFSQEEQANFSDNWSEDGVFLDHIFVNRSVKVIAHGIDTAKVDGLFVSDHFPLIADILLK